MRVLALVQCVEISGDLSYSNERNKASIEKLTDKGIRTRIYIMIIDFCVLKMLQSVGNVISFRVTFQNILLPVLYK